MEGLVQDFHSARRLIVAAPGVCIGVVLCLTIGIGINSAVFDLFHALVLRELPVAAPEHLVSVWRTQPRAIGSVPSPFSWADFAALRARVKTFAGIAATAAPIPVTTRVNRRIDRATANLVSADYFDVLGIETARGRFFLPEETSMPGGSNVAVVSHGFWLETLGGIDPLGAALVVNGVEMTVIGVGPPGFSGRFSEFPADLWLPITQIDSIYPQVAGGGPGTFERSDRAWIFPVGRISEGSSLAAARSELDGLAEELAAAAVDATEAKGFAVHAEIRRYPSETERFRGWATFSFLTTGSVLLIACANVANLLLAHSMTRRREFSLRLALGCSRARLARQIVCEGALLAGIAAGSTVLFLIAGHGLIVQFVPGFQGVPVNATPDLSVVLFVVAVAVVSVFLSTLGPLGRLLRADPVVGLRGGSRWGSPKQPFRQALVVAQVSISVAVLIGAALLARSLWSLSSRDPGFRVDGLVVASLESLAVAGYEQGTAITLISGLTEALRATSGVAAVAVASVAPGGAGNQVAVSPAPQGVGSSAPDSLSAVLHLSTTGYFSAAGIPLIGGRDLREEGYQDVPAEVVVNETLARQLRLTLSDIGRELVVSRDANFDGGPWRATIVGVAKDTVNLRPGAPVLPTMWAGWSTHPGAAAVLPTKLLARVPSVGDRRAVVGVRDRLAVLAPDVYVNRVLTGSEWTDLFVDVERKAARFAAGLGALALALATLGAYATIRRAVVDRRRDLGVRLALGATPSRLAWTVVCGGLRLAVWGTVLGIGLALGSGRLLGTALHGIDGNDPWSILAAVLATLVVVVAATFLPARSAARTDPLTVIRDS